MAARSTGETAEQIPAAGALDLWSADLPEGTELLRAQAATLAVDERERAARFRVAAGRDRFIAARGFLRAVVATYLGLRPQAVPLRAGAHGKPELEAGALAFNLAHAGNVAVCVVARDGVAVGIDTERIAPMRDADGAARLMMSAGELSRLDALPPPDRLRRLYETWTCKEAVLKAVGTGLDRPLDAFEILFEPCGPPRIGDLEPGSTLAARYWLRRFEPAAGFAGAVASSEPIARIRYRHWSWW